MSELHELVESYSSALQSYLAGVEEPALSQAYELGRKAMRDGLGILDIATVHREALTGAMLRASIPEVGARVARRATEFFLESVSAFELVDRGFRQANVTLRHLNETLEHRTIELEATNRELAREIGERQRAEAQLRQSEERFRTLVERVRDYAIFGLDPEGRVTSWNIGAERLSGYRADEIIGQHFSALFTPEDIARGQPEEELRVAAAEGRHEQEAYRVRKDGSRYWADAIITALRDESGDLHGFAKVIRDVTARKQSEDQIRQLNHELGQRVDELAMLNQELEAFSYSISHDLRAPLRAIRNFSEIALNEYGSQLPSDGQRYLKLVSNSAEELDSLVNALLSLSRATRQPIHTQLVEPGRVVQEVLESLQSERVGRDVQIAVADLPTCQADPVLLKQVWTNLISNAIKFTRQRELARIDIGWCEQGDQTAYFVKDNGAGFEMQDAEDKIFGVFQRFHHQEDYEGNGVGLAIVARIVRRHGGRVWAQAEVDRGATFYFTLDGH